MDDKDFPPLFVRLTLRALICGASLVTIYIALARVMFWLGLAAN